MRNMAVHDATRTMLLSLCTEKYAPADFAKYIENSTSLDMCGFIYDQKDCFLFFSKI